MMEYRIKKNYGYQYNIQKKFLCFWVDHKKEEWCYDSSCYKPVSFCNYEDARRFIEDLIAKNIHDRNIKDAMKVYRPKYFYPPLPDKEPM